MKNKFNIPWLSIWLNPGDTVQRILNNKKIPVMLILLTGLSMNLDNSYFNSTGDTLSLSAILLIAIIFSPVTGYLFVWISTYLFSITGQWLGAQDQPKKSNPSSHGQGSFLPLR
ncbi:hypothetical protein [Thermoactinomyces sp. CICC 23799]|uniref:hypothetical protein n=1 Tax=Thermoactinomyces sp. CICC 23799 TaxID=2767429 RepID=UPI0018DB28D3|nr:hypothetical protein [Thermoactinomyces sp. CICC 23799]MBH8599921.1 hypothetical protein [Thermoactinomyces sp. CICC 23799]